MIQLPNEQEQRKLAKGKCPDCGGKLDKIDPGMRYHFYLECSKCKSVYYCHYPRAPVRMSSQPPLPVFWRETIEETLSSEVNNDDM